jgi:cation diffusion facilitator family transporter
LNKFLIKKFVGSNPDQSSLRIRRRCGVLSGVVGIIINLLLFAGKLAVGVFTFSIAATADAFNNLSDAGSSIVTLICFRMAGIPADKEHPFGHGRIEYVSGLIVSIAIIITGIGFIKSSIEKIFSPETVVLDAVSATILIASVIIKVWLNFFNRRLSNIIHSPAIEAVANDSISDAVATTTVILGIFITQFFGWYLDPYAGLIVSGFIILTGSKTFKDSLEPLLGKAPDPEFVEKINNFVLSYPEVSEINDIIVHNYGPGNNSVTLRVHIETKDISDVKIINEIIADIEKNLAKKFKCSAIVRFEPVGDKTENKKD